MFIFFLSHKFVLKSTLHNTLYFFTGYLNIRFWQNNVFLSKFPRPDNTVLAYALNGSTNDTFDRTSTTLLGTHIILRAMKSCLLNLGFIKDVITGDAIFGLVIFQNTYMHLAAICYNLNCLL